MADSIVPIAHKLTRGLIDFLVEITQAAERVPEVDVFHAIRNRLWDVLWLEEIPSDAGKLDLSSEDILLSVRPPSPQPAQPPPEIVEPWLDDSRSWRRHEDEPRLRESMAPVRAGTHRADDTVGGSDVTAAPESVKREFERWLTAWRVWAQEARRVSRLQDIYDFAEKVAKAVEQRDDENELVLARGLVRWVAPDGRILRRHLVTEQMLPALNRRTAEVEIRRIGAALREEDSQLFGEVDGYQHDRAEDLREQLKAGFDERESDDRCLQLLSQWISRCTGTGAQAAPSHSHMREPGQYLEVSLSPALILRPRNKVMLAEAYKRIARELKDPDTPLPVALAQLVVDTEAAQRQQWIEMQNGVSGDFLGNDPRFPLDANPEQERVMELLRTESGVVVQGPPGTGKTHTIANLVSALLARGQRILVTSQKDQALRVLRDKIPQELRHLCVLLTGGSKDAATELQQGLDALSDAVATSDRAALRREADALAEERVQLRSEAAKLNDKIRDLRETENKRYGPVAPWHDASAYSGTLGDIVREVMQCEPLHGWFPSPDTRSLIGPPPLTEDELRRLRQLLVTDSKDRRTRTGQWMPEIGELKSLGDFVQLVRAEQAADDSAKAVETPTSRQLSSLAAERLDELEELRGQVSRHLLELGFDAAGEPRTAQEWVDRALRDLSAGRSHDLWAALYKRRPEPSRILAAIQAQEIEHVVSVTPLTREKLGAARGALTTGMELQRFLARGGKLKKRFSGKEQNNAAAFLSMVQVDGQEPKDLATVEAAVAYLEAEVATIQLAENWADCGVVVAVDRPKATLSQLAYNGKQLDTIAEFMKARDRVATIGEATGSTLLINSVASLLAVLDAVPAALARLKYAQSRDTLKTLDDTVRAMAGRSDVCPEATRLLIAIQGRDTEGYEQALGALEGARAEQAEAAQLARLSDRLGDAHPSLLSMLAQTAAEQHWDDRLSRFAEAWAWHQARHFVASQRSADQERDLMARYKQLEDQIQRVTARLAATEAMLACLDRMSDYHARNLRTYREHMAKVGAGTGRRARDFQRAARTAMLKAKTAVPAWVVPLPNLLDNLPAERNSFDVVIVDEASQVGMEQLFLLWLAPRVIVVGDNKQCTPGENRLGGGQDRIFQGLSRHLGDADDEIQKLFTTKTNLYGLLSARSGKDSVIRLREHFRCVPEIINWPSTQFYSMNGIPGLIPLRERLAGDLSPLMTRYVEGAFIEGRNENICNPVEAKAMADELATCLADPRYKGKTFGMVVLQGRRQVRVLEHEINVRISPEEREKRKIRVGVASDFQGDERDVVFLSMVVATPPRAQKSTNFQQAYNVAASRAKDQLWLFTSITMADLKPDDLRASLLGYMQEPPSAYGASPDLDEVSDTTPCTPFESLLEQRVFREIRGRGYHVIPQYAVGSRRLDLVVVGDGARMAVECDGHRYHTSPDQVASDARRDRELSRMRWQVLRIRESEFEFDRQRELAPLWSALDARGIRPGEVSSQRQAEWNPVPLDEDDQGASPDEERESE